MTQEIRAIVDDFFNSKGVEVKELEIMEKNVRDDETEYSLRILDGEENSRLFRFKTTYVEDGYYYYFNEIEPISKEELNELFGL